MTDDLIARLRHGSINDEAYDDATMSAAADALEAQARRIAALEYDATYHESNDEVMMRDIEYYRARIAELEAAFEQAANDMRPMLRSMISRGEAAEIVRRAARAAYLGEKDD